MFVAASLPGPVEVKNPFAASQSIRVGDDAPERIRVCI